MEDNDAPLQAPSRENELNQEQPKSKLGLLVIIVLVLVAPVFSFKSADASIISMFFIAPITSIAAGILTCGRTSTVGWKMGSKIGVALGYTAGYFALNVGLCFCGCLAGM